MSMTDAEGEDSALVVRETSPPVELDFVEDGVTIPIIPRTDFAFDGRASSTQDGVIAYGVDASEWVSGQLIVLTHARNAWVGVGGTTASFGVEVQNVVLDEEAPDQDIVETGRTIATLTAVSSGTAVPRYQVVEFTPPFGPNLRVRWVWSQGALGAIATLTLAVSVYLVGRRH
jgi:hypothetical protein